MLDRATLDAIRDEVGAHIGRFAAFVPRNSQDPPLASNVQSGIVTTQFGELLPVALNASAYVRGVMNVDLNVPALGTPFFLGGPFTGMAGQSWLVRVMVNVVGVAGDLNGVQVRMSGGVPTPLVWQSGAVGPGATAALKTSTPFTAGFSDSFATFDKSAGIWLSLWSLLGNLQFSGGQSPQIKNLSAANAITIKAGSTIEAIRIA